MADRKDDSEVNDPKQPLPFLEVWCKSSGKIRRFSAGTETSFAVNLINKKLLSNGGGSFLRATHIEAVKQGEDEPVSFCPSSLLVDYGSGWKLQSVIESNGDKEQVHIGRPRVPKAYANVIEDSHPSNPSSSRRGESGMSYMYLAKILLAFLLIFVFGAIFTLFLENLPQLILYINSSPLCS